VTALPGRRRPRGHRDKNDPVRRLASRASDCGGDRKGQGSSQWIGEGQPRVLLVGEERCTYRPVVRRHRPGQRESLGAGPGAGRLGRSGQLGAARRTQQVPGLLAPRAAPWQHQIGHGPPHLGAPDPERTHRPSLPRPGARAANPARICGQATRIAELGITPGRTGPCH
jgi:hypothetical protein